MLHGKKSILLLVFGCMSKKRKVTFPNKRITGKVYRDYLNFSLQLTKYDKYSFQIEKYLLTKSKK